MHFTALYSGNQLFMRFEGLDSLIIAEFVRSFWEAKGVSLVVAQGYLSD